MKLHLLRSMPSGRAPDVEDLLPTPDVSDLIAKGETHKLRDAMKQGKEQGMQPFDDDLYRSYADGRIDFGAALDASDSRSDLALHLRLDGLAPANVPGMPPLDDFVGDGPNATPLG